NVGVVRGGTRSNVVAAHAEAEIDLRVRTAEEARRADERILSRPTFVDGATVRAQGGLNRPPMEETPASRRLYEKARRLAAAAGTATSRPRSVCRPWTVWERSGTAGTQTTSM